jgi:O-methyltransferase involved in polyketide biosynthesis
MSTVNPVKLGSVQKTLLLPLWGRAVEARKPHPLLIDPTAAKIIDSIDYDFSTIAANISYISQLSWIARSLHVDRTIQQFLKQHPQATIVNLGCGLDTTFERVDNGSLRWYDLDLPDVIELRSKYIQQGPRRQFIACSILDDRWMGAVEITECVLFFAAGVLYYFTESEVRTIIHTLADRFPSCELVSDVCSPFGLKTANERVIRDGGMDSSATLKWALIKAAQFHEWDQRINVLAEYPIFRGLKGAFSLKEKWGTFLSDTLRIMSMVHLAIAPKSGS